MYRFRRNGLDRYNKFIFGGNDLSNLVVVENIFRYPLPIIENHDVDIAGAHGSRLMRNKIGKRTIQVTLRFIEDTYEQVQERVIELAPLLYSDTPQKLELRDTDLFNYAKVESISEVIKNHNTGEAVLTFVCHDPFNYGELKTFELGGNSEVVNSGFETDLIFKLTTQDTNQVSIKLNNGRHITLNGLFSQGGQLVIDTKKELATLNGNIVNHYFNFLTDFFKLPNGTSMIQLTGATGTLEFNEVHL